MATSSYVQQLTLLCSTRQTSPSSTWLSLPLPYLSPHMAPPPSAISLFKPSSSLQSFSSCSFCYSLLHNSMLKGLAFSSSLHRFFSHPTKLLPSSTTTQHISPAHFPALSSLIFRRPVYAPKLLAMAEQTSNPASQSHKHTNRLAAEHSPYLLQHAHNPVCV